MRQSFNHRIILLAGTALALGVGIAQAQAPAPPTPTAPPVMRATLNNQPTATTNEVTRLVMQIRGHEIEIVVRNGVPTYRIDGEWHGKDKWRNAADGGFIFDGPDGQPLLTLTAQQALDMGLTQRVDIPRQRATGMPIPPVPRQVRINTQRDTTTNAAGGVVREENVNVEIRMENGVSVALGRDTDGKSWTVREYQLNGKSMPANAYKVTPDRVELFDGDGKFVDVIELADLNRMTASQPTRHFTPATAPDLYQQMTLARPRPMLGITMAAVPESLAAQLGIERDSAVLIGSVIPGQAAEEAGLQAQDVLLWIEQDSNPATFDSVREALRSRAPGETIELGVVRAGKPILVKATLRDRGAFEAATGMSISGTIAGRPGRSVDSVARALEAERAEITTQIQQHEAQLKALTAPLSAARGRDAEQLSRQATEITRRIAELSAKSATLAKREQEHNSKLINELALGGRQYFGAPATPIPPQRWSFRENDGTMLIFENPTVPVRPAMPHEQLIASIREQTGERMGRESTDRLRQIEQRLDRIERLLEELAARPR